MRAAAIDLGTNTVKLAVGEKRDDSVNIITEAVLQPRIGEGVDENGAISADAIRRAIADTGRVLHMAREYGAEIIRVVGTSALRDAANREEVIQRMRDELKIELEVIPEEEECRISYMAIALDPILGCYDGLQVVADVGGGSSELTFGRGREIVGGKSVRIGAVRLTERYIHSDPPELKELHLALGEAELLIEETLLTKEVGRVVGVGGSSVNIARMLKGIPAGKVDGVHGTVVSFDDLNRLIDQMASVPLVRRRKIVGLDPERADIIIGGALILQGIMIVTGANEMAASVRGLRHGVLYEMLG